MLTDKYVITDRYFIDMRVCVCFKLSRVSTYVYIIYIISKLFLFIRCYISINDKKKGNIINF